MANDEQYEMSRQSTSSRTSSEDDSISDPDIAPGQPLMASSLVAKQAPKQTNKRKTIMIVIICAILVIAAVISGAVGAIWKGSIADGDNSNGQPPENFESHPDRAAAVKEVFSRAWDGYYEFAFPNDSLKPASKGFKNDRNGWGASAIDALSTALIMEDEGVVRQILDFIPQINFDKVSDKDGTVSLFESTIRYLGGLLSAHDLLSGPLKGRFSVNETTLESILNQAVNLAENLKVGFNTSSGVPIGRLLFEPPRVNDDTQISLAAAGTLILEWTRLSDKTGNREYAELADKAQSHLLDPKPKGLAEPFPGLLGTRIYVSNGSFVDSGGGWSSSDDSYYEYLIKMYVYDTSRFGHYKDKWVTAADSTIKYLASHPSSKPGLTFLAEYLGADNLKFSSDHLACFDGGNFILGGLTLDRQDYIDFGLELAFSCHETYTATMTGIGPEKFSWKDNRTTINIAANPDPPDDQLSFYEMSGFWITKSDFQLRPEAIESWYYAYRATKNPIYQDWAWEAFQSINKTCSVGVGLSAISDVNVRNGSSFFDSQESFLFAEVLKYSYLIQAEDAPWQVSANHNNQFVYNTEAHPIKVAGKQI